MEHVSPVLACGLLGCHSVPSLQDMLTGFKVASDMAMCVPVLLRGLTLGC